MVLFSISFDEREIVTEDEPGGDIALSIVYSSEFLPEEGRSSFLLFLVPKVVVGPAVNAAIRDNLDT